jgi:hypothetical protein
VTQSVIQSKGFVVIPVAAAVADEGDGISDGIVSSALLNVSLHQ